MSSAKRKKGVLVGIPAITITVGAISFITAIICIVLFVVWTPELKKEKREILKFSALAVTAAAAITSAFYVGQGFYENIESTKMSRTITYATRWNDPFFFEHKKAARKIILSIINNPNLNRLEVIQAEFGREPDGEMYIRDILNLLEEMAVFIDKEIVDEEILRDFYQTIVIRYYSTLQPWIIDLIGKPGKQRLYKDLTKLYEKWRDK